MQFKGNIRDRIISIGISNKGRKFVHLHKKGVTKSFYIHRLVANSFIQKVEGKNHVNHIDNNPLNNCVDNLEWCTPKENTAHAQKQGRLVTNFSNETRKLGQLASRKRVIDTKTGVIYPSLTEAAKSNGIEISTLSAWLRGVNPNPSNLSFVDYKK